MNYPSYPGGNGPQQGGGYPAYPGSGGMPYPQMRPTEGGGEPPPSGGTAITAGVLAILGGLFLALAAWVSFALIDFVTRAWREGGIPAEDVQELENLLPEWLTTYTTITGIGYIAASLLLLVGALLLLMRNAVGRWMVIAGCAICIVVAIAGFIAGPALVDDMISAARQKFGNQVPEPELGASAFGGTVFIVIIPALVTLILAAIPPTGRWIAAGKRKALPPTPYQGYPQQPPGQW